MTPTSARLATLARELSLTLDIDFVPTNAGVGFGPMSLAEWSVPLIFDGHLGHRNHALVPCDFVGHVLWPALRQVVDEATGRSWWTCELGAYAAAAIIEDCRGYPVDLDADVDGLVEVPTPVAPLPTRASPLTIADAHPDDDADDRFSQLVARAMSHPEAWSVDEPLWVSASPSAGQ
ncbi:MAG: hypothetical protein ACT4OS_08530 [Acidimicrobiales bacterium]